VVWTRTVFPGQSLSERSVGLWQNRVALLIAGCGLVCCGGCVERRLTIRSTPPGALVVLDGQEIGHAPVSTAFTYYGEREVKLIKDGFETKTINQTISTPWYQYFPLDLITEGLVPWRIRDERNYLYTLEPAITVANDQLYPRAEALRQDGRNPPPDALRRAGLTPTP
jgi:hypothetical protein